MLNVNGTINTATVDAVEAALATSPEVRRLRITSAGGQSPDGLRFARLVRQRSLDVEVSAYCVSACAQYVFVAGQRKIVAPMAIVAFHGTPASIAAELLQSPFHEGAALFANQMVQQNGFYRELGIDPALLLAAVTYLPPLCVSANPAQPKTSADRYMVFFAPTSYVLDYASMTRLGISGIEGFWPTSQASLDRAVRSQPFKDAFVVKFAIGFDRAAVIARAATVTLPDCMAL